MAPSVPRPWLRILLGLMFAAAVVVGCGFDLAGIGDAPLGSGSNLQPGVGPRAELFVVTPTAVTLNEGDTPIVPATFTVKLTQAPSAPVTIPMLAAPQGRIDVQPSTLTFTPDNFGVDQTVTLTTTKNSEIDPATFSIDTGPASSADALFDGANPPDVKVAFEDANPAIEVQPRLNPQKKPFSVSEQGTTTTFYVSLNALPTDKVVVHMRVVPTPGRPAGAPAELGLTTNATTLDAGDSSSYRDQLDLEFPAGWPIGKTQTVTVIGVDDQSTIADPKTGKPLPQHDVTIEFPAAESTDPRFSGKVTTPLVITSIDNDTPNVLVSKSAVAISEPATSDTFTVALATQPTQDVLVNIANPRTDKSTVSATALTFTPANWSQPQTVTVAAKDNPIVDGTVQYVLHLTTTSTDAAYNDPALTADVTVTNADDDTPSMIVSPTTVTTNESGTTQGVQVRLKYQPLGNVVVTASSNRTSEATVAPASLTFTSSNWNTDQVFTVQGVNDNPPVADGSQAYQITIAVDAANTVDSYDAAPNETVSGSNGDNDTASVTTSPPVLTINENGSGSFNVHLNTQPVLPVKVRLAPNVGGSGADVSGSVDLVFDSSNWAADQQATFNIGHDCYAGDIAVGVQVSIVAPSDPAYAIINPPDVTININDIDPAPAVTVVPTTLNTTHGGSSKTFDVQLTTRPRNDVRIPISSDDTSLGTVNVSSLTFAASDATCPPPPQTVTVTPKTGASATGTYHIVVSTDTNGLEPSYKSIDPPNVTVNQN